MINELNEEELKNTSGGNYHIYNNDTISFDTIPGVCKLDHNRYEVMAALDGLIGQYPTQAEYDQACLNLLIDRRWIK